MKDSESLGSRHKMNQGHNDTVVLVEDKTRNKSVKTLLVLSEPGTLDHAVAVKNQLCRSGAIVEYTIGKNELIMPGWAQKELADIDEIPIQEVVHSKTAYSAAWFQEPYQEHFSPEMEKVFSMNKLIYSGYGIPISNWFRGYYLLPIYKECELVAAPSPRTKFFHETQSGAPKATLWTGDPLLFELINFPKPRVQNGVSSILWAPHWSDTWVDGSRGFSRWRETVGSLLSFFRKNGDVQLVIRGHPFFETTNPKDKKFARALLALKGLRNVQLSKTSMKEDITNCDALITDGVSILAYGAAMQKPIGFLEPKGEKAPFNAVGRAIADSTSKLVSPTTIRSWLQKVASDSSVFSLTSEQTKELVLNFFPLREVSPGEQIYNYFVRDTK